MSLNLKIRQTKLSPTSARVWLDGHEITTGLMGVTVFFDADDITKAELRIAVDGLDVDAETLAVLEAYVEEQAQHDEGAIK